MAQKTPKFVQNRRVAAAINYDSSRDSDDSDSDNDYDNAAYFADSSYSNAYSEENKAASAGNGFDDSNNSDKEVSAGMSHERATEGGDYVSSGNEASTSYDSSPSYNSSSSYDSSSYDSSSSSDSGSGSSSSSSD